MSLLFLLTYVLFPEKYEGADFNDLIWRRGKEIAALVAFFCISIMSQNIYYDFMKGYADEAGYFQSSGFITFVIIIAFLAGLAAAYFFTRMMIALKTLIFVIVIYAIYLITVA